MTHGGEDGDTDYCATSGCRRDVYRHGRCRTCLQARAEHWEAIEEELEDDTDGGVRGRQEVREKLEELNAFPPEPLTRLNAKEHEGKRKALNWFLGVCDDL